MIALRRIFGFGGLLALSLVCSAMAQDLAPTPRKSPLVPVSKLQLAEHHKSQMPASRNISGFALIIDNEKLRIGEIEMRLFGVVPPQLSAPFGPQARAVLDKLTSGTTTNCVILDRDRDGRFLATCKGSNNADLALELLRRGLAITARGSLRPTELAAPYGAAEQAAESQNIGLWSVNPPAAAKDIVPTKVVSAGEPVLVAVPAQQTEKSQNNNEITTPKTDEKPQIISAENTADAVQSALSKQMLPEDIEEPGFFARYQVLVTGLIMLLTTLSIVFAVLFQRWKERRDELRSIAAAIRGELMAARSICQARLKSTPESIDEKSMTWPRIRTLVFQAYVGRLGRLGATLARQVASIYGQTSDYSAYYGASVEAKSDRVSKRRALQMLVQHIEEVLPKLASIETGKAVSTKTKKTSNRLEFKTDSKPLSLEPPVSAVPDVEEKKETETTVEENAEPVVDAESSTQQPPDTDARPSSTAPLWDKIRKFATERIEHTRKEVSEDVIPDYANMTEEEIESLAYAEILEDEDAHSSDENGKKRHAG